MTKLVGRRFEIISLAGQGGMGRVFRAWDTSDGQIVALKFLRVDLEPEAAERFRRESDALERLDHPGIVRYVARGTSEEGAPYLAMQWLEGEELGLRLRRSGVLSVPDVVKLANRLASALAHAHERGITHRDVKPSNVILPTEDLASAVLIDFGLARSGTDGVTRAGMIVGTPTYMAPEQVREEPVTPSVDVFALGCVIYECLTHVTPFGSGGATAVLARVLFGQALPLTVIAPAVPPALGYLVDSMLHKLPKQRPSMNEVLEALDNLDAAPTHDAKQTDSHLSSAEQRVVGVIVAGVGHGDDADVTLRLADNLLPADVFALRRVAARFSAELTLLPNGTLIAVLSGGAAATDLAAHAADCALALKSALGTVPVGLVTGRAQTGEGVPIGEGIDRAVQLSPFTGDAVRIDEVTAGLVGTRFEVEQHSRGPLLLGRAAGDDPARTLLGRRTPCVGREAELATLQGTVAQSASESVARAVLVTGPAGAGKSRIRQELLSHWRAAYPDAAAWICHGDSVGAGAPFGLLGQVIRREAGVVEGDSISVSRDKLLARVRGAPEADARRVAAFLGEIIGVRFDDDVQLRAARNDARLMGDQMQRAFLDLVDLECRVHPLVLVLEDLQWGDQPTVAAVDAALRLFEERPLAVVAFGRPEVSEVFPELWSGRRVLPLELAPLPKKAAARLVRAVLEAPVSDELVGEIVDQAGGNAFLLEELVRAQAEGRGDALPPTVVAAVQSRLAALEPEMRRVLRAASVLGETFRSDGVRALLGEDATDAERWLDELGRREVLAPRAASNVAGSAEYSFRHALLREGAYAMLTDDDRVLGHRLAAEWLEQSGEASPLLVASHYERAGERARAAVAYLAAAEQALESSDLSGAIDRAERGIALGASGELVGALRSVQAHAHHWRGETERMETAAAEAVARLGRDDPRWPEVMALLAVAQQRLGKSTELSSTASVLHEALSSGQGDRAALARAGARVASLLFFAGRQESAAGMLDAAEMAAFGGGEGVTARIHQARAPHARQAGRVEEALRHAEAAARAFEIAGDRRNACMMTGIVGFALSELGAYAQAEVVLKSALATAEELGLTGVAASARANLGLAFLRLGRPEEAEASVRFAILDLESNDHRHEGGSRAYLAMILRDRGRLDEAEREARRSLELLEAALALRPLASAVLATVLLAAGRDAEALEVTRQPVRWSEAGGNIEEGDALLRLTLARALLATEREEEAKAALADAESRLRARANTVKDDALRRTFLENVPEHKQTLELAGKWRSLDPASRRS